MKKLVITTLLATTLFAGFSACHKDSGSGSSITATINGASFSKGNCVIMVDTGTFKSLQVWGAYYNPSGGNGVNTFAVPFIQFNIIDYTGPGTYAITDTFSGNPYPSAPIAEAGIDSSNVVVDTGTAAVYGTITITATSTELSGTFSFTTKDSTKVTNGKFTGKIQYD